MGTERSIRLSTVKANARKRCLQVIPEHVPNNVAQSVSGRGCPEYRDEHSPVPLIDPSYRGKEFSTDQVSILQDHTLTLVLSRTIELCGIPILCEQDM